MTVARRGKSVDYPAKSFQSRKHFIKIINANAYNYNEVADSIWEDHSLPVDEKVIAKISWERFIKSLGRLEKRFVKAKLKDLTTPQVCQKIVNKARGLLCHQENCLGEIQSGLRLTKDIFRFLWKREHPEYEKRWVRTGRCNLEFLGRF